MRRGKMNPTEHNRCTVYYGDSLAVLKLLPDESAHCCVTSPPYWGLRDYGTAEWEGGDADCDHLQQQGGPSAKQESSAGTRGISYRDTCGKCGARRIDNQLGLESTPEEYVANLVKVFREVRRVLRDDGTVWLNLGDSYARAGGWASNGGLDGMKRGESGRAKSNIPTDGGKSQKLAQGLKEKDLVGIPWRVAFALQADGWWLRQDIIWHKPNPMPESVTDRCTKAHEYIFLLTKSAKYFYDAEAIKEKAVGGNDLGILRSKKQAKLNHPSITKRQEIGVDSRNAGDGKRNKRSVWTITTKPGNWEFCTKCESLFEGKNRKKITKEDKKKICPNCKSDSDWASHFAAFPKDLIEPCILAGTSEKGNCAECGKPWERTLERIDDRHWTERANYSSQKLQALKATGFRNDGGGAFEGSAYRPSGWQPTCKCDCEDIVPCRVLDPFAGSGTVGIVSKELGRVFAGVDLNPEYVAVANARIETAPTKRNVFRLPVFTPKVGCS